MGNAAQPRKGSAAMIALVEERREAIAELCRRYDVRRMELFGSAANGDFREADSDIDLLVEFADLTAPDSFDRYFDLLWALEALFGRHVDLVVASAVKNSYVRASI